MAISSIIHQSELDRLEPHLLGDTVSRKGHASRPFLEESEPQGQLAFTGEAGNIRTEHAPPRGEPGRGPLLVRNLGRFESRRERTGRKVKTALT
jgi:hypothetical protein